MKSRTPTTWVKRHSCNVEDNCKTLKFYFSFMVKYIKEIIFLKYVYTRVPLLVAKGHSIRWTFE